jgi:hypothetical protein
MLSEEIYEVIFFLILFISMCCLFGCCVWIRYNNYHPLRNYTQIVPVISYPLSRHKQVLVIPKNHNDESSTQQEQKMTNICT